MSEATTRGIRVNVESIYVEERSAPSQSYYFFAYHVTITNTGDEPAQLISRVWTITDANGNVERVEGPGVVGEQPRLEPGASFEYTSFCPLTTSFGTMEGFYVMKTDSGETFDAEIGSFTLEVPNVVN
jgi:ApaG protein